MPDVKRLKALEDENGKLKRLLAEQWMQNGFVESFNGRMRIELLNETMFRNLAHARIVIRDWVHDYNTNRPHSALGYETPEVFAKRLKSATSCHAAPLESSAQQPVANPALNGVPTRKALVQAG